MKKGVLTNKYYEDKKNGNFEIAEEAADCQDSVMAILDSVHDSRAMQPEDARKNNVELRLDKSKLGMPEFKKLWANINAKTAYVVKFDQEELIQKAISALDRELRVSKILIEVETGMLGDIESREQLQRGTAFMKDASEVYKAEVTANAAVKYDLVWKVVAETGLTRKAVVSILRGMERLSLTNSPAIRRNSLSRRPGSSTSKRRR